MTVQLWLRPWALVERTRRHRIDLVAGEHVVSPGHRAALWLYTTNAAPPVVDRRPDIAEPVPGFNIQDDRSLSLLPVPLRRAPGSLITTDTGEAQLQWPGLPERPPSNHDPQTDEEWAADRLRLRAEAVWDRLQDVETALANPARLWETLRQFWTETDKTPPQMAVIVAQARDLAGTLAEIEKHLRHVLRRTHRQLPIARVQELDRRAMLWLARQPGTTLAERAGDTQRILAVARTENFDTLENRVLRAYAELARRHARDYLERNRTKRQSTRAREVEAFGRRCKRLARDLVERGVGRAEPGITPNYVLQQNPRYHQIWQGWQDLLKNVRRADELWRWQARSWEEYCALVLMVSLSGVPGARLIASSPLVFREEQQRGSWVDQDNPLGVFYLPGPRLVVEVRYRMERPGTKLADFGAAIWLRIGSVGDTQGFQSYIAVWPIWDCIGGLVPDEAAEIAALLPSGVAAQVAGGIVLRPATGAEASHHDRIGDSLCLTLGTEGAALRDALATLTTFFAQRLRLG